MKLNNNEKNVIIVFDSSIDLILSVSKCSDDNFLIFHSHNPEEFGLAVKKFNDNISIIIAKDECESYDTLDVLEQFKNDSWFENASSLVIAGQKNTQREQRALKIGIKDYIGGTSDTDIMVSHELKLMIEIQKLKSLSNRDGLTGLYNQSAAKDIVFKTLHNDINQEFLFAIIDLDYFKQVNDVKGHQFGDLVLKKESKHIKELLNDKSVAIRYGGDEFIFVTPLSGNIEDMAQSVYDKTHFVLSDYQITNSIGISTTLSGKREIKSLFQMADKALYNAKANGRNQYCIYTDDLSEKLDGAEEELRNEVLNLDASSLIHSLINNYEKVYHLDLNKIAVTKLCKKANGDYGWSSPIEYIPYINSLLQNVEEKEKLRQNWEDDPQWLAFFPYVIGDKIHVVATARYHIHHYVFKLSDYSQVSKTVIETDTVLQNYGVGFKYERISNSSPQYRWFYGTGVNGDYSNALSAFEWDDKYFVITKYPLINGSEVTTTNNFGQLRVFTKDGKSTGKIFQYVGDGTLSNMTAASFWGFYVDEKTNTPLVLCDSCNIPYSMLSLEIIKSGENYGRYRMRISMPTYSSNYMYTYGNLIKTDGVSLPLYIAPFYPYNSSDKHYFGFALGIFKTCLTTINNLSSPVRKLDGQVMKITYDIVDE